jgi:HK97 family phage prohead protease
MNRKARLSLEIKEISKEGTFEGWLSTYGNVDRTKDIVEPGSYTKTLKEQGATRPLLWQHKSDTPIGEVSLEDRGQGLWCKGSLLLSVPQAKIAYDCIKAGIVKGLSIGFESIKDSIKDGVRHLNEIKLYEASVVTFPANDLALIVSAKAAQSDSGDEDENDFYEELDDIQTLASFYQMQQALQSALYNVIRADLDRDAKIAAQQNICEQFAEAMTEFFPKYLDQLTESYGDSLSYWSNDDFEHKAAGKTKRVAGEDLPASAFAYVGDKADTSTWKLPYKFSTDEKTKRHIRNALARFGQTQGIPESERAGVLAKLKAAAKKYGITVSDDTGKAVVAALEHKLGARFSAETKQAISDICGNLEDIYDNLYDSHDSLQALIDGAASDDKAAQHSITDSRPIEVRAGRKTTAVTTVAIEDHSAAQSLIDEIGSLIPRA